jgi:hypothetical protein
LTHAPTIPTFQPLSPILRPEASNCDGLAFLKCPSFRSLFFADTSLSCRPWTRNKSRKFLLKSAFYSN